MSKERLKKPQKCWSGIYFFSLHAVKLIAFCVSKFVLYLSYATYFELNLFCTIDCSTLFKIWRMRIKIMNDSHIKSLSDHICIHLSISYHCPLTAYIYKPWYICCISHLYDYGGGGLSWHWINVDKRDRGTRSIQITYEFCPLETQKFVL